MYSWYTVNRAGHLKVEMIWLENAANGLMGRQVGQHFVKCFLSRENEELDSDH